MTIESAIDQFGYVAVLIGTFFEGETVLILGGFAASRAYLVLPGVIIAAFFGSFIGDQFYFYLGRKHGRKILDRYPSWSPRAEHAQELLKRYETPLMVGFRFMLGLRMIAPFVIGMSNLSARKFILLNAVGACAWAVIVGFGGFVFGQALELALGNIKRYEIPVFCAVVVVGLLFWLRNYIRSHRKARNL